MGINWGSLAAGFADGYSAYEEDKRERARNREDFEAKQEILDEYQKRGEERRAAREGAQRREKEKEFIEQQTAFLKSIGLSDDAIGQVMSSGKAGLEFHTELIGNAMAKGYDPNELYSLPSIKPEDPRTVAKVLDEMPDVYADKDKMALDTGRVDGMQETTAPGFNLKRYRDIMAPEKKYANSFAERLAVIAQKKVNASQEERAILEAEEAQLLSGLSAMEKAKRKDGAGADGEGSVFSKSSVNTIVKSKLSEGRQAEGFTVDLEGNIIGSIEGRALEQGRAYIRAYNDLIGGKYGESKDPFMLGEIANTKRNAVSFLNEALDTRVATLRQGGNLPEPLPVEQVMQNAKNGNYKPGDVIIVRTPNGGSVVTMYTGINNPVTNTPFFNKVYD